MDDVFVYLRSDLPDKVKELVTPCAEGYTVYINAKLDNEHRMKAYEHALRHIESGDFDTDCIKDVQTIETDVRAPERIIPIAEVQKEIDEIKKRRLEELQKRKRKLKAQIRENNKKIAFLESEGFDFFAAAEENYLNPEK